MENKILIYNTLNRKKELFEPFNSPYVGMYVCGPTVYGTAHLGHARAATTFDLIFRYLIFCGYKVRYVRNITDVGHLENDADEGEDKIAKKAKAEKLEPMEIVQFYTNQYQKCMELLNNLKPSIEPHASGHIPEQLELIDRIYKNGYAYEANGSVYFDVEKYSNNYNYGKLSGRKIDELLQNTRELDGQSEKRKSYDFALWKKAAPEHIMRWNSKWSEGFPGWHLECSAMGIKYLGEEIDIHGGGLDLQFPHHECEIAQTVGVLGKEAVKYWMHNNLITINGQKMGKSLGNAISLEEFFTGNHKLLDKPYSPMVIRYFILSAHYRSPLDFSNEALQAAEKGMDRLMSVFKVFEKIKPTESSSCDVALLKQNCFSALNDDFNTPILLAHLFDGVKMINSIFDGKENISKDDLEILKKLYHDIVFDILGLMPVNQEDKSATVLQSVVDLLLNIRQDAKQNKDFATSDKIRNELTQIGFIIKDRKDGFDWEYKG